VLKLCDVFKEWTVARERMDMLEYINKYYDSVYDACGFFRGYIRKEV